MTITADDIIIRLWELANMDPSKTKGKTSQKSAFRLILELRGGVGFIAGRPATELEELARRGVSSADLRTILREIASVELACRKGVLDPTSAKKQMAGLIRAAAQPGHSAGRATEDSKPAFQKPDGELGS